MLLAICINIVQAKLDFKCQGLSYLRKFDIREDILMHNLFSANANNLSFVSHASKFTVWTKFQ